MRHSLLFLAFSLMVFSCSSPEDMGDERYGIMNTKGEIVTPAIYDGAEEVVGRLWGFTIPSDRFHVVSIGKKKGIIGPDGKQIGQIEFDDVSSFSHPLYQVFKKGKTGFMNQQGKMIIPCIYDEYEDTNEYNNRYILKRRGKYGMVDENNRIIFPFEYSEIDNLSDDGYCSLNYIVRKKGKYALANKEGTVLTPFKYDEIILFQNGGGRAEIKGEYCFLPSLGEEIVSDSGDYFYVDSYIKDMEGLVSIRDGETMRFYTYDGKKLDNEYPGLQSFRFTSDGLASIETPDKWIVIDTLANTVIDKYYPKGNSGGIYFMNGLAIVRDDSDMVGIIDTNGDIVLSFIFEELERVPYAPRDTIQPYSFFLTGNGDQTEDDLHSIWSTAGKYLNHLTLSRSVFYFAEWDIIVIEKNSMMGVISVNGEEIVPYEYSFINLLDDGLLVLSKGKLKSFYNIHTGNSLPLEFEDCNYFSVDNLWMVEKDGKQGVINAQCEFILPCEYASVEITTDGHFIVSNENGMYAILDRTGKVTRPFGQERLRYLWDDLILFETSIQ